MGSRPFEYPATLLQLLQRAALENPSHGQILLENGLGGGETALSYPELLEQATVSVRLWRTKLLSPPYRS